MKELCQKIILFGCACIPGCGEMYLGYLKRGASFQLAICGVIMSSLALNMDVLLLMTLPLWVYSFFDTFRLHRLMEEEDDEDFLEPDNWLFGLKDTVRHGFRALTGKRRRATGIFLLLLGIYSLCYMSLNWASDILESIFPFNSSVAGRIIDSLCYSFPRLYITILLVVLAVWFIREPKHSRKSNKSNRDFTDASGFDTLPGSDFESPFSPQKPLSQDSFSPDTGPAPDVEHTDTSTPPDSTILPDDGIKSAAWDLGMFSDVYRDLWQDVDSADHDAHRDSDKNSGKK